MRILALSAWWPEPADNGSRQRISQLLRSLAQEHEVHLVALAQRPVTGDQVERLSTICASVQAARQREWKRRGWDPLVSLWNSEPASVRGSWNPDYLTLVRETADAVQPDMVIAFQLGVARYAMSIDAPRVLEEVELSYLLDKYRHETDPSQRLRRWMTWAKHRRYVARLIRHFDACTVVSEAERAILTQLVRRDMPVAVVPNGADIAALTGHWGLPLPDTLVYPGALSFEANYDAVWYFASEILPLLRNERPDVCLQVTGASSPTLSMSLPHEQGLHLTGYLNDVRPFVARAWAEVVPLRLGGGTRLKILEALALGTPVVSTSKGVEGLDLVPGEEILIADTPEAFAAETLRLLSSPALRDRLSTAGRAAVVARYDWRSIGEQFNSFIREVAAARGIEVRPPQRHEEVAEPLARERGR